MIHQKGKRKSHSLTASNIAATTDSEYHWSILALPFVFFGIYFFMTLALPPAISYDEAHYVPAAKQLVELINNRNWEHPPLGKYLIGLSWLVFHKFTGLLDELSAMRLICVAMGLWALLGFDAFLKQVKLTPFIRLASVWSVAFNMIWFVQSKTAMLDIFYIGFGVWGLCWISASSKNENSDWRHYAGWICIGLAMGSKWSALPFAMIGFGIAARNQPFARVLRGLVISLLTYFALFIPMLFLKEGALSPADFIHEQFRMLSGLQSTSQQTHSYQSSWWQWPTLQRPMWYLFQETTLPESANVKAHYCVFMGGNPLLFWLGNIAVFVLGWLAFKREQVRRDGHSVLLLILFTLPFLVWSLTPRKLMFFYYVFPACLWYGPILFVAAQYFIKRAETLRRCIWGFITLEGALFFFFLPILDGRAVPYQVFLDVYQWWMYRLNWI